MTGARKKKQKDEIAAEHTSLNKKRGERSCSSLYGQEGGKKRAMRHRKKKIE